MSCGIACHENALANVWGYGTEEGKRFFYAATAEWTAANSSHRDNDSRTEQVTVTPDGNLWITAHRVTRRHDGNYCHKR
jgi:hypothetical protein